MANIWKNLIYGLSLPLIASVIILVLHVNPLQFDYQFFTNIAPFLLLLAALLSLQFKRSRLAIVSGLCTLFMFGLSALPSWLPLHPQDLSIWLVSSLVYLLWSQDRGVFSRHGLIQTSVIGAIALFVILVAPWLNETIEPQLRIALALPAQLGLPAWHIVTLLIVAVLMAVRLFLQSTHCHGVLVLIIVLAPLLVTMTNIAELNLIFTVISVVIIAAVLLDSFEMAYRDELTGLPSRRALNQYAMTLSNQYTVVMLDVDHFKKFNDTYGHDVGDQVLKLVAAKMRLLTGGGRTYRYGGEEFTAIFPRKKTEEVMPHIEALREVIANYEMRIRSQQRDDKQKKPRKAKGKQSTKTRTSKQPIVKITISLGLAQRQRGETFEETVKRADEALYRAKEKGRNCSSL